MRESVECRLGKEFLLLHEIQEIDQDVMELIKSKKTKPFFIFFFNLSIQISYFHFYLFPLQKKNKQNNNRGSATPIPADKHSTTPSLALGQSLAAMSSAQSATSERKANDYHIRQSGRKHAGSSEHAHQRRHYSDRIRGSHCGGHSGRLYFISAIVS